MQTKKATLKGRIERGRNGVATVPPSNHQEGYSFKMASTNIPPPSKSGNPAEPNLTRFEILRYGAFACGLLQEFLELLEVKPPSGPLAPATELSFSKDEIRGRMKADPEKYLEILVTIETRLRLSHIWPGNLEKSRTHLEAWASLTSYATTSEEFAKLLYLTK